MCFPLAGQGRVTDQRVDQTSFIASLISRVALQGTNTVGGMARWYQPTARATEAAVLIEDRRRAPTTIAHCANTSTISPRAARAACGAENPRTGGHTMGAYGNSRLRQWIFGGFTRHVLRAVPRANRTWAGFFQVCAAGLAMCRLNRPWVSALAVSTEHTAKPDTEPEN
jgi:hypothetical protein